MRRLIATALLAALTACQASGRVAVVTPAASPSAGVAAGAASPKGAIATASPAAPTHQAGVRLVRPNATVALAGHVALDASYLVSNNAGRLVANNGGTVLAAGAASLSADGKLIANNGGGLIAEASGNIISDATAGVLANNGSSLINDDGLGLVANNGGGVLGDNGVGVIPKQRRVLADAAPAYGQIVTAAGVALDVRSLATGKLVPVGADPAGKPVYVIYTNLAGDYEVYLPEGQATNVLVEAAVPQTQDPRAQFTLVAPNAATHADIDEDTGLSSREIQEVFANRLEAYFADDPSGLLCVIAGGTVLGPAQQQLLAAALTDLHARAVRVGITRDPARANAVHALAVRCANTILAQLDLATVRMEGGEGSDPWGARPGEKPESAMQAITEVLKTVREGATPKLAADADFFSKQPYFQTANACEPGRYVIKKPADASAFLMREYVANSSDPAFFAAEELFTSLGVGYDADGAYVRSKLNTALDRLAVALATTVFANAHGELDAVHAQIDAFDPDPAPGGIPLPTAPSTPCPRPIANARLVECKPATGATEVSRP